MAVDLDVELDMNLLTALEALLAEANVTRAAQKVGITQSAMSHKLRRLRELFDDPLLVGGRGGMKPTPRAVSLLGPLRRNLRELRALVHAARPFEPATAVREFTVVSTDFAEFEILPRVLEDITVEAPQVSITMREPWPGMVQALEDGSVDVVMGPPVEGPAGLVRRKVADDEFVCVVRRDHPGVAQALDLDAFLCLPHLLVSPRTTGPGFVDEALAAHGLRRRVALRIPHFLGAPFVIARSDLVATLSRVLAEEACLILPLRMFPVPIDIPPIRIFMTWHERFSRDPGHAWLREKCYVHTLACFEQSDPGPGRRVSPKPQAPAKRKTAERQHG